MTEAVSGGGVLNLLTSTAAMRENREAMIENGGPIPRVLAGFLFNLLG